MGHVGRYPQELRERAVRMVAEVRSSYRSRWAAIVAVAEKLGIGLRRRGESAATARACVRSAKNGWTTVRAIDRVWHCHLGDGCAQDLLHQ